MEKQKIAVDIDEVLFPFLDEFIKHHNQLYGSSLQSHQFSSYEFGDLLNLSTAETVKRIYDFTGQLKTTEVEPIQLSQDSIAKLSTNFDLVIVTARHSMFKEVTVSWLETHFPNLFKKIEMIGHAAIMEIPLTKAEVCLSLGATALIDDSLTHIKEAVSAGIEGVLFGDYRWNQIDHLPDNATRCTGWPEVLIHFNV